MRRHLSLLLPLLLGVVVLVVAACTSGGSGGSKIARWESSFLPVPPGVLTPDQLLAETRVKLDLMPPGAVGRRYYRPMRPRYITIHSTQNYTGNAYNHALALKRGALRAPKRVGGNRIGFLTWHFTVQDDLAIQHLPCREQGEHADFDGPGNNYSIGIEMCEHSGNDIGRTIDKTARLAAYLMRAYDIPLSHVVPHYHWERKGLSPAHKDCPHFLLERGRPGSTWRWFINRVNFHHSRMLPGAATPLG
ncbi:MAG TPA: peptidoglycan recognition family protein [Prosthecobacter sp.]